MCNMFSILGAIFALGVGLADARHRYVRVYPFASADCNGPPIMGNNDVHKDVCTPIPFGGSSIKLMEVVRGDWTKELSRGPTGCYFYAYTQFGCLERYLDTIVDPGDVINMCIPSRDANDPILSVSFSCIYGAPPLRRGITDAANKTLTAEQLRTMAGNDRPATIDGVSKFNSTHSFNDARLGGRVHNVSARSVQNHGPAFVNGEPNFSKEQRLNNSQKISARSVQNHGPAFINGEPNFSKEQRLNNTQNVSARSVQNHGPASSNLTSRGVHPDHRLEASKPEDHVGVDVSDANQTKEKVTFVGVPNPAKEKSEKQKKKDKKKKDRKEELKKQGKLSDSDFATDSFTSDWEFTTDSDIEPDSDSGSDDDETRIYLTTSNTESNTPTNTTSLDKRMLWWQGPRRGVWMLHPWTGGLLCYECFSKHKRDLTHFECRAGPDAKADCGERPLAPIYTRTATVQPVVTVTPIPQIFSLRKRSWHKPVYLQNPWYTGITVCAHAEWEGRGEEKRHEIRIERTKKNMKGCDRSPIAQNIAVWIRSVTTTMPVKTVSVVNEQWGQFGLEQIQTPAVAVAIPTVTSAVTTALISVQNEGPLPTTSVITLVENQLVAATSTMLVVPPQSSVPALPRALPSTPARKLPVVRSPLPSSSASSGFSTVTLGRGRDTP